MDDTLESITREQAKELHGKGQARFMSFGYQQNYILIVGNTTYYLVKDEYKVLGRKGDYISKEMR
jgi:hypothetical protein